MRGTVTKKGNKWYIVYDIGIDRNGKRKQKWESGFKTKKQAEETLAKRVAEIASNTYVEPSSQTLQEFIESWAQDKKAQVRIGTWRSYEWNIRVHILPHLGNIRLRDLKAPQIQHFYSTLRRSPRSDGKQGVLSERSILHVHLILHQVLQRAVRWGYIGLNPCTLVDKPKPPSPELSVWSLDEVQTFLKYAKGESKYIVFLLLFTTGMRIGEVLGLRWEDVNVQDHTLSINQQITFAEGGYHIGPPKTKAGKRTIDINREVIDELLVYRKEIYKYKELFGTEFRHDLDLVCCTPTGTPLYRGNVALQWDKIIKKAGLKRIRMHDARHTHATLLLQQGESLKVIQERLGHEKADVLLNTYAHLLPRMQRNAVDNFGKRLFGASTPDSDLND